MCFAHSQKTLTAFESAYDPVKILQDPSFRIISDADVEAGLSKDLNIACAYNPAHEVHLVEKPVPKAREGECVVHVRATGICG